jgi:hypothetical protein
MDVLILVARWVSYKWRAERVTAFTLRGHVCQVFYDFAELSPPGFPL